MARCICDAGAYIPPRAGKDWPIDPDSEQTSGSDLDAAIAALWADARPRTIARIDTIEAAIASLRAGTLDAATAEGARREAHKLAGALGTFGLPQGTELARALERGLDDGTDAAGAAELGDHAAALRRLVEAPRG